MKIGLCSITFRQLDIRSIVKLAVEATLDGIEWGGDKHVPPGELNTARQTALTTQKAGLEVSSYGSYYRTGSLTHEHEFDAILATAVALQAPSIRVWAGEKGSVDATAEDRKRVVSDAQRIATLAQVEGIAVHFEYHGGTLTDTKESAQGLMVAVDHPNVGLYWQPAVGLPVEQRVQSIRLLLPYLTHVHVFQWHGTDRLPLSAGEEDWATYLHALNNKQRYAMLEFVKNDDPAQFIEDAKVLRGLLS
ncbi:sugar phosphate isomerase/epimerase family protein [Aureibacillus halotolerans]|uniref:Sugar phosphate isomerase/epimerase n=1 Tax=Aureibacillus halotolerans TaxID=1508390 RepID=A0A4V3D5P0_9BACI|nr:sugar phosphate isomerase/epimerase [Aureibacillus halotolerans]TDQ40847.1 sugar phosphate isomerase/epimerase [Aureibacillus halotolerans]